MLVSGAVPAGPLVKAVRMWRVGLAVSVLAVGGSLAGSALAGAFTSPPAAPPVVVPGYPIPPGWTANPSGVGNGQMCFDSVCYRVDGQGRPYGPPLQPTGA